MLKALQLILLTVLVFALLLIGYLRTGPYLDRRAISKATEFCSLISVGENFNSLASKAEKNGISLEKRPARPGGRERYIANFSGFFANSVHCEVSVIKEHVYAKFVEEEFW